MDEELIQKIAQQVMEKLGQGTQVSSKKSTLQDKKASSLVKQPVVASDSVIFLLCGGDKELPEVYRQMEIISKRFSKVYVAMTYSAQKIIGIPEARRASQGGTIITEYSHEYLQDILFKTSVIYVPVLSLNTAAKVVALNADSLGTITIVFGLMYGKQVVAARDSIFCCQVEPQYIPEPMMHRIDQLIQNLENMGITMVSVGELSSVLSTHSSDLSSSDSQSYVSGSYTTGTAGKAACETGECNECGQCVVERSDTVTALVNTGASRIAAKPGISEKGFNKELAKYIDHTLLKPDATDEQIRKLCEEAKYYEFASVCVNPTNVAKAAAYLKGSPVKVCTVIGFPLGASTATVKSIETRDAIANGAEEVDMVINVGSLKSGNDQLVREDIEAVVAAAKGKAIVKVILETALLTKEEIVKGSLISKMAGADFIKTSTGFSSGGATVEDIALMRQTVGPEMGVKASGGIRSQESAQKMIRAGATRIGASASIKIVQGELAAAGTY